MLLPLPAEITRACGNLTGQGWQAYVVGGAVRDLLLGVPPQDWDLATDAPPQETARIFTKAGHRTVPTGIRFGTVTVFMGDLPVEITTFRQEQDYLDFRRPNRVRFIGDLAADLARRDFTINALAYDPQLLLLHDPLGGLQDLAKGRIRAVGDPVERIAEDPLRMLRGIRLAAELGFRLEERTCRAILREAELIGRVAAERVREEFNRTLLSLHFLHGLELMLETGLLFLVIPELKEGWLFAQYHPFHRYTVLKHTLEALRYTPSSLRIRLAVLLHDVGKPRTFSRGEDGRGHFYGHNQLGAEMAGEILRRLRYGKRLIREVLTLIREHMLNLRIGPAGMRRLLARVGRELMPDLLLVRQADFLAHSTRIIEQDLGDFEQFRERLEDIMRQPAVSGVEDLAVNGYDVQQVWDCQPGPEVGYALRVLWNEVLVAPWKNNRPYLLNRLRELAWEIKGGGGSPDLK